MKPLPERRIGLARVLSKRGICSRSQATQWILAGKVSVDGRVVREGTVDEIKEFIEDPSMDELSDIVYCLNRAVGSLFNKSYVRLIPGDKLHVDKINKRMEEYGCIRSPRHLLDGKCPSL